VQGVSKTGSHVKNHTLALLAHIAIRETTTTKKLLVIKKDSELSRVGTALRLSDVKVYTVEHNTKVYFIDKINPQDEPHVNTNADKR
jgi:hypothetical protein